MAEQTRTHVKEKKMKKWLYVASAVLVLVAVLFGVLWKMGVIGNGTAIANVSSALVLAVILAGLALYKNNKDSGLARK